VAAVAISFLFGQRAFVAFVPLAVCGYLAGVLLAELAMPRPTRTSVRRASLRRRSIDAYVPPALVWGWRVSVVVAVVALVGVGVTTGGSGGSPVTSCPVLFPVSWLGWGYGVPALVTLLAGAVLVEALLLRVPGRPRPDPAELPVPVDDGYRVASAHRALSAGYTLALIPIAELALLAAGSLGGGCAASHQAWATPMMVMLVVLGWAAGFGALVGVARFLTTPDWFPPSPVPGDES
jgi:hypothetical protein